MKIQKPLPYLNFQCIDCKRYKKEPLITIYVHGDIIWICKECLEKALTLINKEVENEKS